MTPTVDGFAKTLRRALAARGMQQRELAAHLGVRATTVSRWCAGAALPRLHHSAEMADVLDWPSLAAMVRDLRTTPCPVCGRLRVHGSNQGRYCSRQCQNAAFGRRAAETRGKVGVMAQHRLHAFEAAVDDLCRKWCEPEGLCRDASCPVQKRGLSPLPLAPGLRRKSA